MDPLVIYAAGLFDGEGSVSANVIRKTNYNVDLFIGMTCPHAVLKLRKRFGGGIYVNHHEKRNPKHRPEFCWFLSSAAASRFLRAIRPYVIVKKDEVETALTLQDHIDKWRGRLIWYGRRDHAKRDAILAYRAKLKQRLIDLKHLDYGNTPP